jgi:hypothetical protein
MAKYGRPHEEDEVIDEVIEQKEELEDATPQDPEEASFKKRYGDLRRHMQNTVDQKEKELAKVQDQLEQATRKQIKFPKSESEIKDWVDKYPDVAAIVDTIAQKRALEALEMGEKKMERLQGLEKKLDKDKAEMELKKFHPDFDELRADKGFHQWVAAQPKWIQDALYENETDARSAARAIDLYKADVGKKKKGRPAKEAAQSVSRSKGNTPANAGKNSFSESQIEKMTAQEYEKNEDAILDSMKNGTFEYDLTGAAR